ncbi:MAG: GNAT family N-acetyltransferase [Dongiaceae bacterium]
MREVDWANLHAVLALDVAPPQQSFVASNAVSIAEAHFNPGGWFRAVYADDVLVGFVMLFDSTVPGAIASDPVEPTDMVLWRLMIDRRYQRRGLGHLALDAVREHVTGLGRFHRLLTSYMPGSGGPKDFYLSYGFTETGRLWDNGTEVEIALQL